MVVQMWVGLNWTAAGADKRRRRGMSRAPQARNESSAAGAEFGASAAGAEFGASAAGAISTADS